MKTATEVSPVLPTVDLFIQHNCPACEHVRAILESFSAAGMLQLQVYSRGTHRTAFSHRKISIVPATFIENRLTFYGEFTAAKLQKHLDEVCSSLETT